MDCSLEKGGTETAARTNGGGWGKPPHFDRLRRLVEGERGSRGEMRRMRAKPEVRWWLAWRRGRTLGVCSQGVYLLENGAWVAPPIIHAQAGLVMSRTQPP